MKKNIILIPLLVFCICGKSQSFELGLRGGCGSCWLLNNNVSNAGNEQNYSTSFYYSYGLFIGYDINHRYSLEFDVLSETINQNYKGSFQENGHLPEANYYVAGETYSSQSQLYIIEIPAMLHYNTRSGLYFELGPEYQFITDAGYTASYSNPSSEANYSVANEFAKSNILVAIGVGWNFRLIPKTNIYAFANIRYAYGLTDIRGVDGFGQNLNTTTGNPLYSGVTPYYSSYQSTHMQEISLNIGIYYRFSKHYSGNHPTGRGRVY